MVISNHKDYWPPSKLAVKKKHKFNNLPHRDDWFKKIRGNYARNFMNLVSPKFLILHKTSKPTNFVLQSQKLHNPWTGDTSFTWRNRSKSDVYAAPTAGGFPYSSTLSREAEKVSLQENLRKEKRGLDNLHLLWMRLDKFNLSFFELKFASCKEYISYRWPFFS